MFVLRGGPGQPSMRLDLRASRMDLFDTPLAKDAVMSMCLLPLFHLHNGLDHSGGTPRSGRYFSCFVTPVASRHC